MARSRFSSPHIIGYSKDAKKNLSEVGSRSPKLLDHTRSHVESEGWADDNPPENTAQTIPDHDGSMGGFLADESKVASIVPRGTFMELWKEAQYKDKLKGGLSDHKQPSDFNKQELEEGAKEEEHTNDPAIAKEIAMDHLTEFPHYYKALDKMEDKLKKTASIIKGFKNRAL